MIFKATTVSSTLLSTGSRNIFLLLLHLFQCTGITHPIFHDFGHVSAWRQSLNSEVKEHASSVLHFFKRCGLIYWPRSTAFFLIPDKSILNFLIFHLHCQQFSVIIYDNGMDGGAFLGCGMHVFLWKVPGEYRFVFSWAGWTKLPFSWRR